MRRPIIMTIAGYDPCGGAGVLADIKTTEAHKVYGVGVCSSITYQNEDTFEAVDWLPFEKIKHQITLQFEKHNFQLVKIGLIESLEVLHEVIVLLKSFDADIKIIWDPILKASAGFSFYEIKNQILLEEILRCVYLITPNIPESKLLSQQEESAEVFNYFEGKCHVLLKGGHATTSETTTDVLQLKNGDKYQISSATLDAQKHGTGCILSASILANMALSESLLESCHKAKKYIYSYLKSDEGLLGYHGI